MAIIKGVLGNVYLAYGTSSSFTTEAMTANGDKTVFTITDETKRFWDQSTTPTVYYNGNPVTTYSAIQYPGGIVTWAVSPGALAVTVSGKSYTTAALGECRGWTMEIVQDYVDVTAFGDTMRVMEPVFKSATATIDRFYLDNTILEDVAIEQLLVGYDLFADDTLGSEVRFTGYGYITTDSLTTAVDNVITEPLTIQGWGQSYLTQGLA